MDFCQKSHRMIFYSQTYKSTFSWVYSFVVESPYRKKTTRKKMSILFNPWELPLKISTIFPRISHLSQSVGKTVLFG